MPRVYRRSSANNTFEKLLELKKVPKSRTDWENGTYTDPEIEVMFQGFLMAYNHAFNSTCCYVIAKVNAAGKFEFRSEPRVYSEIRIAEKDLESYSTTTPNTTYVLFTKIKSHRTVSAEPSPAG